MLTAPVFDLIGDTANLQQGRLWFVWRDKCADALQSDQVSVCGQFAQGAVYGHSGNAQRFYKIVFGRYLRVSGPTSRRDPLHDIVFYLLIERGRLALFDWIGIGY